ncbi:alpha/beta hydrolase family protein [uncultured Alistipes sp.]|uniref:alpha/beta hydrolase n=1 Tax=uncultured Alistipes sp. TaxID=538949 RepID=UPI000E7D360F|nr:alpha/beta hydrolase family protein [uncultured Alistipes sp.]HBL69933.1 XynC protein [Alistipes sp.]HBW02022.1 XynC protein [Alistipes sp.]
MRRLLALLWLLCVSVTTRAAVIDTVAVFSARMQREIPAFVVVPEHAAGERLPVVYLLHGFGNNQRAWLQITDLRSLSERYRMIFVCPDGEKSWYWDSPLHAESQFETFISGELPAWIDARYPTIAAREGRAITGLSMGGHGALWNAVRHPDVFGAAGSTSGGVDIRPFPDSWEMKEQLGELKDNPARWDAYTVINAVDSLHDGDLSIIFDCGYDDFFYEVNVALHEKLLRMKVGHDFLVRPGAHTWEYWAGSLPYQLLFFERYFERAAQ